MYYPFIMLAHRPEAVISLHVKNKQERHKAIHC